jgi:hypothetical protein
MPDLTSELTGPFLCQGDPSAATPGAGNTRFFATLRMTSHRQKLADVVDLVDARSTIG